MRAMFTPFALLLVLPAAAQAAGGWRLENGAAVAEPHAGNSNVLRIEIACGEPYRLALYTAHGPVLPVSGQGDADYFYTPGRIEAEVDGRFFPLVAAGSDDAVVLFGEGTEEEGFMSDPDPDLLAALAEGGALTLSFDIAPAPHAETDSPFETFAQFSLEGAGDAVTQALAPCGPS
jgi:hypothetical protein